MTFSKRYDSQETKTPLVKSFRLVDEQTCSTFDTRQLNNRNPSQDYMLLENRKKPEENP